MKKILLSVRDLRIGGIEKSLINFSNYLIDEGYNVTLVMENVYGNLLDEINPNVKIMQYLPSSYNIEIFSKCINFFKRLRFILKYKNKYDIAILYATYLKSGSFVVRNASKKSILWCHADYLSMYNGNKKQVLDFFEDINFRKFSKIVFVSDVSKRNFLNLFPEINNVYHCNNLINYEKIYEQSCEKIELKKEKDIVTFLNVGRHDEKQKKLSRIIEVSVKLKNDGYDFRVLFVGDGQDTEKYIDMVKKYNVEKNVVFVGKRINPYPYFNISDCVLISSDYEGYPVVLLESYVLNKPIITTDVVDISELDFGRCIVVEKDADSLYVAMKKYIEEGIKCDCGFDSRLYNKDIKKRLRKILEFE